MNNLFVICFFLSIVVATVVSEPPPRQERAVPECHHGETKQIECNTCKCNNGKWTCPRKLCLSRRKRGTFCTPGSTYKQDCNTCVCNSDGTNAACTLKGCF